jgi:hypothetical protein
MRRLLARLAVMGAFAISVSACGGGNGSSLPAAGPPNNAGGNSGTLQSGSNGLALIRFLQGSPDASPSTGAVDVCVDNLSYGVTSPAVAYGKVAAPYAIPGGIAHTIAVYTSLGGTSVGAECPTAPGPYLGVAALKVTTISPAVSTRQTVVLGGTVAGGTLGLYVYTEPTFPIAPGGPEAISHNAAPTYTAAQKAVGFGTCSTTATPCVTAAVLAGAGNIGSPKASSTTAATANTPVVSALSGVPAGFYDGIGVASGNPVPITSIAAAAVAGQPFVVQLYAVDGPAGALNLVGYVEATLGYGF